MENQEGELKQNDEGQEQESKIPETGIVEEDQETGEEGEEDQGFYLGDRIKINSKYGEITGTIYYFDPQSKLSILPDGVNHKIYDFEFVDTENGKWFDPELQVDDVTWKGKGPRSGFVSWQNFQSGQELISFLKDGEPGPSMTITDVNVDKDSIRVRYENGDEETLDFDYKGIPQDTPIRVLQIKNHLLTEEEPPTPEEIQAEEAAIQLSQTEGAEAANILGDEIDFQVLGEFEVPDEEVVQTIPVTERVYDEVTQKSSLLSDLISLLDTIASQRNPEVLRKIRSIVEMISSLKNSVVRRGRSGVPEGEEQVSLNTLSDALKEKTNHLAKPILDTKRVALSLKNDESETNDQFVTQTMKDVVTESTEFLETQGGIAPGEIGVGIPRWYNALNMYFKNFPLGDKYENTGYTFKEDGEYFRFAEPGNPDLLGVAVSQDAPEVLDYTKIDESLRRAHGPTYRALTGGGTEIAIPGDRANVKGYVLFPYKSTQTGGIGSKRTGSLFTDILRSTAEKTWMSQILKAFGGVTKEKDAQKIVHVDANDVESVGIPFTDYLKLILEGFVPKGAGDLSTLKHDLGIEDTELTPEQQKVVSDRILEVLSYLRETIRLLREDVEKQRQQETPVANFLLGPDITKNVEDKLVSHPLLSQALKDMHSKTPGYKQIDIAAFSYMLVSAQDYFLAVLGGDQTAIQRERDRFITSKLLDTYNEAKRLADNQRNFGSPPRVNPCYHVPTLTAIRKVKDDSERMALMNDFVKKFQGDVDGNWLTCIVCKQHLICRHEVLQIQQYLHPNEKATIDKMLNLDYAGERFGTSYICKICGQRISDLDFDKGIEFDDNSKPMMGRAVIVDKDALAAEEIETKLLGIDPGKEDIDFGSDVKNQIYKIVRVILDELGVDLEGPAFQRIVNRGAAQMSQVISQKDYISITKDKKVIPYGKYLAQKKIALATALVLIEIQTHVPDILPKFRVEGCPAGFGGYPLIPDVKPEDPEKSIGIQYISCIVSNINRKDEPWVSAFQTISSEELRKNTFMKLFVRDLVKLRDTDFSVRESLEKKAEFLSQLFKTRTKGRPNEQIPPGFLPSMETSEEAAENAAKAPAIAEGAKGQLGDVVKATSWIRAANGLAKDTARVVKGSPFAESSCCFDKIDAPGEFFKSSNLPDLPDYYVLKPGFARQSILYTPIVPRELQPFNATQSLSVAYRVLLELCYRGQRVGETHEFGRVARENDIGYDYKCDWCGLEIPPELLYTDVDNNGVLIVNEEIVQSYFDRQGLHLTEKSFQKLLDIAHAKTEFSRYVPPKAESPNEILQNVQEFVYEPFPEFNARIEEAKGKLNMLGLEADPVSITQALAPILDSLEESEDIVRRNIGMGGFQFMEKILKESPHSVFEMIRSYFLIPAQRILSSYENDRLKVPAFYKLSSNHTAEINTILATHTNYLSELNLYEELEEGASEETQPFLKANLKLTYFVQQLSEILNASDELRLPRLRFSDKIGIPQSYKLLLALLRTFLFGPLGNLLNEASIPESEYDLESIDPAKSDSFLKRFVVMNLERYKKESLAYNPDVVKQMVADAAEREKQRFISELDRMTEQERKLELEKKKLGLGRWAVGGTKLVYSYDADYWDKTREEIARDYATAAGMGPDGELPENAPGFVDPFAYRDDDGMEGGEGYYIGSFHPENEED
jgi:hypothetical protein